MEFPKIIRGVWDKYSVNAEVIEIPIEDIVYFEKFHESYRNGNLIVAQIRSELNDIHDFSNPYKLDDGKWTTIKEKRKYDSRCRTLLIRGKDMPTFRKNLLKEFEKSPTEILKCGINAGTPIAQSNIFRFKRIYVKKGE